MTHEILKVTPTGDFVWHEDADRLIEEGDFTNSPSMQHILRALRKQRTWVGLTGGEVLDVLVSVDKETVRLPSMLGIFARAIEAKLKEKNT